MYTLGIETSCDETSAAVVKNGKEVLSCAISSSLKLHKIYGGVIPEIASRAQLETITDVTDLAMREAKLNFKDINLICVTSGPGLIGSLFVGISFAKALSFGLSIPLLGVNHVKSHIYANFLNVKGASRAAKVRFPFVALVVSGGHTSLYFVGDFDRIELLGQTRDDACGEAFDKVAKILGLGYPGGPFIEKLAKNGNPNKIKFRCSDTGEALNFSFSGIKTAVFYYVSRLAGSPVSQLSRQTGKQANRQTRDIAASFQEAAIDALIKKSFLACELKRTNRLVIGGGVVVNNRLREKFLDAAKRSGIDCLFPAKNFCMDNAAMVAGFGFQLFKKGSRSGLDLDLELSS